MAEKRKPRASDADDRGDGFTTAPELLGPVVDQTQGAPGAIVGEQNIKVLRIYRTAQNSP